MSTSIFIHILINIKLSTSLLLFIIITGYLVANNIGKLANPNSKMMINKNDFNNDIHAFKEEIMVTPENLKHINFNFEKEEELMNQYIQKMRANLRDRCLIPCFYKYPKIKLVIRHYYSVANNNMLRDFNNPDDEMVKKIKSNNYYDVAATMTKYVRTYALRVSYVDTY